MRLAGHSVQLEPAAAPSRVANDQVGDLEGPAGGLGDPFGEASVQFADDLGIGGCGCLVGAAPEDQLGR